jgi:hypothetical protein
MDLEFETPDYEVNLLCRRQFIDSGLGDVVIVKHAEHVLGV